MTYCTYIAVGPPSSRAYPRSFFCRSRGFSVVASFFLILHRLWPASCPPPPPSPSPRADRAIDRHVNARSVTYRANLALPLREHARAAIKNKSRHTTLPPPPPRRCDASQFTPDVSIYDERAGYPVRARVQPPRGLCGEGGGSFLRLARVYPRAGPCPCESTCDVDAFIRGQRETVFPARQSARTSLSRTTDVSRSEIPDAGGITAPAGFETLPPLLPAPVLAAPTRSFLRGRPRVRRVAILH